MDPSRYQLTEKIAQGGMAEVYTAEQVNTLGFRRTVAIKKILPKHMGSSQHESMLINEAKLLVSLNHPNIVKVYDLGCRHGIYYVVMEFIDGCDLRKIMQWYQKRNRRLPLETSVMIAADLAKALYYAHQKTDVSGLPLFLVHMDVSPKNILLSKSGEVKLSDFGIASFRSSDPGLDGQKPATMVVRGKYSYMSPEQALGGIVDARSDIFSLGLVLYEMLSGTRLFRSSSLDHLQKEHREHQAQAPLFNDAEIPVELEYILLKCLAHDPNERYENANLLYRDLLRFLFETLRALPHHQLAFLMDEVLEQDLPRKIKGAIVTHSAIKTPDLEAETMTAYHYQNQGSKGFA